MKHSVQIIIISSSNKRKEFLDWQFFELKLNIPIIFLNGSTPENSKEYLDLNSNEHEKKIMCCAKSHCRAIELASDTTATDFTIIMEDDALLYKNNFEEYIDDILKYYNENTYDENTYISIGYIPLRKNYGFFEKLEKNTFKINSKFKSIFYNFYGLQAYIIKKSIAKKISPILNEPSCKILYDKLSSKYNINYIAIDVILYNLLKQQIIFPPLVIERYVRSLLGHNQSHVLNNFFIGYEKEREKYFYS